MAAFMLVVLLPAGLIGIFALRTSEDALKESVGTKFSAVAREKADAISRILEERTDEAAILAAHPLVEAAVREANLGYSGGDDGEIQRTIERLDGEWIASKGKTALVEEILDRRLSAFLKAYQERAPRQYGEIFVTDRNGAAVAMTKTLSDYYQADEEWWTAGFNDGRGNVFLDDRGFDLTVDAIVVGVVVPVMDGKQAIGVLKINYRVDDILNIVAGTQRQAPERVILARSRGGILMGSNGRSGGRLTEQEIAHLEGVGSQDANYFEDRHLGWNSPTQGMVDTIEGHAAVDSVIYTRVASPGAIKGVSGEHWEPTRWHLFIELDQETAFAGISSLRQVLLVVVATALCLSVGLGLWISRTISRPILALREGVEIIGSGNLEHRIGLDTGDEIGALSGAFDQMTARLQESLASRADLNREIEEHRKSEVALRKSEQRNRDLVDYSPDAILVHRDRKVIFANPAAARLLAADSPEDLIGLSIADIIPAEMIETHLARTRKMETEHDIVPPIETKLTRLDGIEVPVEAMAAHLTIQGRPAVQTVARDITERKRTEEQLRQTQKLASIGELAGGVAHEFNNLLTVVLGNLQMLREDCSDDARQVVLLENSIAAARRGGNLTHQLLSFSRKQYLRPEECDIRELVLNMMQMLHKTIGENIVIKTNLAEELGIVDIDANGFEGAILNLALNARDAMPEGGMLTIGVANVHVGKGIAGADDGLPEGDYVSMTVTDTGCGMAPRVRERAFDPFFTTKAVGEGTGLGLSMVHGFVKQSGGHAFIESEIGKGTTVMVYLPFVEGARPRQPERAAAEPGPPARRETVLVVEDDLQVREVTAGMLGKLGYSVVVAGDGPSALKVLKENGGIVVVLTDVVMPGGMSGFELMREVRRSYPGINVLLMSGYPESDIKTGDDGAGYDLLGKPYTMDELAGAIRTALGK